MSVNATGLVLLGEERRGGDGREGEEEESEMEARGGGDGQLSYVCRGFGFVAAWPRCRLPFSPPLSLAFKATASFVPTLRHPPLLLAVYIQQRS